MKKTFKTHLLSALIVCLACPTFTGCDKDDDIKYVSRYIFSGFALANFQFVENNSEFYILYDLVNSNSNIAHYYFEATLAFNNYPRRWEVISDFQFTIDIFQTTEDDSWENPDNWKKIDMKFDIEGLPGEELEVWHSDYSPFCKWSIGATYPIGHFIIKPHLSYKHYPNAVIDENYNIVSLGEAVLYDSANKESLDRSFEYFDFWTVLVPDLPIHF